MGYVWTGGKNGSKLLSYQRKMDTCRRGVEEKEVVYSEFNEYHLVLRLLFSYFKASNIINKLLCSLGYYLGSFKIRK